LLLDLGNRQFVQGGNIEIVVLVVIVHRHEIAFLVFVFVAVIFGLLRAVDNTIAAAVVLVFMVALPPLPLWYPLFGGGYSMTP
jgi:hypothetical protein